MNNLTSINAFSVKSRFVVLRHNEKSEKRKNGITELKGRNITTVKQKQECYQRYS